MQHVLLIADHMAIAVFAITGALMASRKQLDILGFIMLGTVTGIGGGSLRDVLLGVPVFWISTPSYVITCVVVTALTYFIAHFAQSRYRVLLWLDAVGLSLFAVLGAEKALTLVGSPFIAVVMGVMSATFGGIIRDVVSGEAPVLLRPEIYVTAALAGAVLFVVMNSGFDFDVVTSGVSGFVFCFAVRGFALRFGWSLPTYKSQAGRSQEELEALGILPKSDDS